MSKSNESNIVEDLLLIHSVITRALDVTIERSQFFAVTGFPSAQIREGFLCYVQSLVTLLHTHHLVEDEAIFPYLQEKQLDADFDLMDSQHQDMLPVLTEIETTLEKVATNPEAGELLSQLNSFLNKMGDIWDIHCQTEEEQITVEKVNALIDREEQIRQSKIYAEHSKKYSHPPYLILPFILYNLSAADRQKMSEVFDPVVSQQLVPIDWKDKWKPMLPFLIS